MVKTSPPAPLFLGVLNGPEANCMTYTFALALAEPTAEWSCNSIAIASNGFLGLRFSCPFL
jgi:hypothetical protein